MDNKILAEIDSIANTILADYGKGRTIDKTDVFNQPNKDVIIDILNKLIRIVYPGYFKDKNYNIYNVKNNLSVIIEDA